MCVRGYSCIPIRKYTHTYMHTYACLCVDIYVRMCVYTFIHTPHTNTHTHTHTHTYIYIYIYISSSTCHAASTDIPDPLSPLFPIVHRLWQVFKATSRILT